ncbi:MAG TPA: uracil-DNA glycosylase [Nitrososphaerales archaeon]|nr:uracil-DNA glycosylase [Nitrososphaerales archaeon]
MTKQRTMKQLSEEIISCRKCPRLVEFRERIAIEKRKQFADFEYWGKPVAGFGDPKARLVVIGLAPAAHGGNRTGRVFTGDSSAKFLVKHLYDAGFSNQPTSETRGDGLQYNGCYVTAAVRCVPPDNKPSTREIETCAPYLEEELQLLKNSKAVLALGKLAFDSFVDFAKKCYDVKGSFKFKHGEKYILSEKLPAIFASYHPSPRNTNTGKMTSEMFTKVLAEINTFLKS